MHMSPPCIRTGGLKNKFCVFFISDCVAFSPSILGFPKISEVKHEIHFERPKGPVIIYDRGGGGGRRKTAFSGKICHGPLGARTKNFAAHSTSRDNFSTPTLEVQ